MIVATTPETTLPYLQFPPLRVNPSSKVSVRREKANAVPNIAATATITIIIVVVMWKYAN